MPDLQKLIDRIIEEHIGDKQERKTTRKYKIPLALNFFTDKFQQYYCTSWNTDMFKKSPFLPSFLPGKTMDQNIDNEVMLSTADEVFKVANPLCASLLPEVIELFEKKFDISLLGIQNYPTLSQAFDTMIAKKNELLTVQSGPTIFEYLDRLGGLSRAFARRVSKLDFIPLEG